MSEIEEESFYNIIGEEVNRTALVNQMINYYALKLEVGETRVTDFNEGSEIRNLLESFAVDLYYLMEDQYNLSLIAFVETAEGEWLDKHGANPFIRLPRDTGMVSTGYVTFSVPEEVITDTVIPEGVSLIASETGLEYVNLNECVIAVGETEATATIECLTVGSDGNLPSGSVDTIDDDYLNIPELSVTNEDALVGGTDYEEDDEYRDRLLEYLRQDDFGSIGYYTRIGEEVDGVHDVYLIEDTDNTDPLYTRIVLVNGDVKPTPNSVLAEVLSVYSDTQNLVIGHNFTVAKPTYVNVDLTVNLTVTVELDETELTDTIQAIFDGGSPVVGFEFDGLNIGETLTRTSIVSTLEMFEGVTDVSIIYNNGEMSDISVDEDEVLKLRNLTINQTVEE